jgi:hypothetical protein
MVEYHCKCCNYTTNKKSNFENHNKGKKHLEKLEGISNNSSDTDGAHSMISIASTDSYMTIKVRELENIIKMQEVQLKMKNEQIEMLKNTIDILSQNKPTEEPKLEVKEEPKLISQKIVVRPKKISENIKLQIQEIKQDDNLTLIDIEEFFKNYIQNSEETKYTHKFKTETTNNFTALKPIYYKKEYSHFNVMKAVMTIITDAIKRLPKNVSFYICKDERRRKFDIKSNNQIIESKNVEQIDKLILKLFKDTYNFLLTAFQNMNLYFSRKWTCFSHDEEEMIKLIYDKKLEGEALTKEEQELGKKSYNNTKVADEFKKVIGCDYELFRKGWDSELKTCFYSFDEKEYNAGFSHLRTFMATNKYDETTINKEYNNAKLTQEEESSCYSDNE